MRLIQTSVRVEDVQRSGSAADLPGAGVARRGAAIRVLVAAGAGRVRTREDGSGARRGVYAKLREKRESCRGVKREILLRRVPHLTRGVIFGSRKFIDKWFE